MEMCDFEPYPTDGRLYCNATFDGVQCWNYTVAGALTIGACPPNHPYSILFDNPAGFSYRKCDGNGEWWSRNKNGTHEFTKTDYSPCASLYTLQKANSLLAVDKNRVKLVTYIYISGYALSMLLLLLALMIFGSFKQLHCKRVTIHSNLFVSFILSGTSWVIFYSLMMSDSLESNQRPMWCYFMHGLALYTTLCKYAWMLSEGVFLHFSLIQVFSSRNKLFITCCIIGWVLPGVIIGAYCIVRIIIGEKQFERCWAETRPFIWIIIIPVILSLVLNLIFLINIMRILSSKLRSVNRRNGDQYKKTARAILILVPLLGLQNILMPVVIDSLAYEIFAALVTSYQGALVAVLFCFLNGEVLTIIKRKLCHWCSNPHEETEKISLKSSTRRLQSVQEEAEVFLDESASAV